MTKNQFSSFKKKTDFLSLNLKRLLQTFTGALQKKNCTRVVFKETPTNYIPKERLLNVKFDKIMFCFVFCFPKAAEVVNSEMTDSRRSTFFYGLYRYVRPKGMVFRPFWS